MTSTSPSDKEHVSVPRSVMDAIADLMARRRERAERRQLAKEGAWVLVRHCEPDPEREAGG